MRAILMAAVLTAAACGGGGGDDRADVDGGAAACEITDERGRSCSRVCTAFSPADLAGSQLCGASATWDRCVDECVAGRSGNAWCP